MAKTTEEIEAHVESERASVEKQLSGFKLQREQAIQAVSNYDKVIEQLTGALVAYKALGSFISENVE